MRAPVILVLALLAAGCVGPTPDDTPRPDDPGAAGVLEDPVRVGDDHDHGDPTQHAFSHNASLARFDPVVENGTLLAVGELDVRAGVLAQAIVRPGAGVVLYDVSDPAEPVQKGTWRLDGAYGADVKLSPDGKLAFLAVEPNLRNPTLPFERQDVLGAGTDQLTGVYVLDVTDLDAPALLAYYPLAPMGAHMLATHTIDGEPHLFAAHNSVGTSIFRIGAEGTLTPVGRYEVTGEDAGGAPAPASPHDMTVQDTPDGRVLMSVPHGYEGLHLVDVTDPANPQRLGVWFPEDGESYYVHTAMTEWRDGKRYTYAVPEVWGAGQASLVAPLWVVDSTDPANMHQVGEWTNPGGHGADNMRFSTHNFQLVNQTIYLAHYHAGVWRIDVTDPADPVATGYYLPYAEPAAANTGYFDGLYNMGGIPTVWDVVVHHGYAYVSDTNSGLYVVYFADDPAGDAGYTGFA